MAYIGNSVSSAPSTPATDFFSGNGVTTTFTLSRSVQSFNEVNVYVNNVPQNPFSAFGINGGNQIVFSEAPSAGSNNIYVRYNGNNISTIGIGQGTIGSSQLATGAPIWDVSGNVTISGNLLINSSGAMMMPSGTTAQRPSSPQVGMIRYNTTLEYIEEYRQSVWQPLSNIFTATGGTETTYTSGGTNYKVHTFTSSDTFTVLSGVNNIDYLIVAGGGAGGGDNGGGGGAGGFLTGSATVVTGVYTIIVGGGGVSPVLDSAVGGNGTNSSAFGLTAIGGGGGGSGATGGAGVGQPGGSGGGGNGETPQSGGAGTTGQGRNGGSGASLGGGGGGGAGAVGQNGGARGTNLGGNGGSGLESNIRTGTNVFYAGGGAGGNENSTSNFALGGAGGGGNAGFSPNTTTAPLLSATVNTGGGGAGGTFNGTTNYPGGAGGSGIVVIRYIV